MSDLVDAKRAVGLAPDDRAPAIVIAPHDVQQDASTQRVLQPGQLIALQTVEVARGMPKISGDHQSRRIVLGRHRARPA
jgi:hypothetical protein